MSAVDETNRRIDRLTLAVFAFGAALSVSVIGGMIGLAWAVFTKL